VRIKIFILRVLILMSEINIDDDIVKSALVAAAHKPDDDWKVPGALCSPAWFSFLQSTQKNSKTKRFRAKCSFCG
jgi:hypothetical protein